MGPVENFNQEIASLQQQLDKHFTLAKALGIKNHYPHAGRLPQVDKQSGLVIKLNSLHDEIALQISRVKGFIQSERHRLNTDVSMLSQKGLISIDPLPEQYSPQQLSDKQTEVSKAWETLAVRRLNEIIEKAKSNPHPPSLEKIAAWAQQALSSLTPLTSRETLDQLDQLFGDMGGFIEHIV